MSETVTIKSGSTEPSVVIYNETFGTEGKKGEDNKYPFVDAYNDWVTSGEGASTVTYVGSGASLRNSGKLSAGYEGASGNTKLFFGANASFEIQKITLKESQTKLRLTFGASYSKNNSGTYDNEFKPGKFHFYLSGDGQTWSNAVQYEFKQADEFWVFATSDFTLKDATSTLYIKYAVDEASVFSIDDVTLATGNGGEEINLSNGGGSSTLPETLTIPELIKLMTTEQTVLDNNADHYLTAVVQSDVEGGNYTNNNLVVATENATKAGNGIMLFGKQVDPKTLGLKKGDKIKITLHKGKAQLVNYQGVYEITGAQTEEWATIVKEGSVSIEPIEITPNELINYQSMTVKIKKALPQTAGVWGVNSPYTFTSANIDFPVFCKAGAAAFVDQPFSVVESDITGIVTLYKGVAQLAPRDMKDVAGFTPNTPTIISAEPNELTFSAEGGSENIVLTILNIGNNTLTFSGLSGILNATINGTTVTVTAKANLTESAIKQTLTISLTNGNSIDIPVTVAAPSTGNKTIISVNFSQADSYPSTFPTEYSDQTEVYSFEGYDFTFSGTGYRFVADQKYLIIGKKGAYIEFPAIANKKLVKVTATTRAGASKSVLVGIANENNIDVKGGTPVKWEQADEQLDYIYNLSETTVNTKYRIYISSKHNAQFTNLELIYE